MSYVVWWHRHWQRLHFYIVDENIGFWASKQPNPHSGECVDVALTDDRQTWELTTCESLLPFMCRANACPSGKSVHVNCKRSRNGRRASPYFTWNGTIIRRDGITPQVRSTARMASALTWRSNATNKTTVAIIPTNWTVRLTASITWRVAATSWRVQITRINIHPSAIVSERWRVLKTQYSSAGGSFTQQTCLIQ